MEYIELICHASPGDHTAELLISLLADAGFESFTENENGTVSAFIQAPQFTPDLTSRLGSGEFTEFLDSFHVKRIADQNWNAIWESQYAPVLIDDRCLVRAPFHPRRCRTAYGPFLFRRGRHPGHGNPSSLAHLAFKR